MTRPGRPTFLERVGSTGANIVSLEPARPRLRRVLRNGLVLLVLVSLGVAVASQWSKLPAFRWRFDPAWLAASIVASLTFLALNAAMWRSLVRSLGHPIPARRARSIWATSLLARYVPTNALMVVGRVAMAQKEGVPQRVCVTSVVYELALQVSAALALGAYFVVELPALQGQPLRFIVLALPVLGVVTLHPRIFHPLANLLLTRLGREGLPLALPFARVLLYAALYAGIFVVGGLFVFAFAQALYPVGGEHLATVLASWAVGFAVAVVAFVIPAGLGAREAGLVTALSPAMPTPVALAVAVAIRILQTGMEVLFAALSSLLGRRTGVGKAGERRSRTVEPRGRSADGGAGGSADGGAGGSADGGAARSADRGDVENAPSAARSQARSPTVEPPG